MPLALLALPAHLRLHHIETSESNALRINAQEDGNPRAKRIR